jgi:hypothetical protein
MSAGVCSGGSAEAVMAWKISMNLVISDALSDMEM